MEPYTQNLPPVSDKVNIECLVNAFNDTVGSHKFLLLRSILNKIHHSLEDQKEFTGEITYDEIRTEMLINAWFPAKFYRLYFGPRDKISDVLDFIKNEVFKEEAEKIATKNEAGRLFNRFSNEINKHKKVKDITIWPITRFLAPWFRKELKGAKEWEKNKIIIEASNSKFDSQLPLYKINFKGKKIVLHQNWIEYLQINYEVIEGWLNIHWLRFLQSRNPHMPSIVSKLWSPPDNRESLRSMQKLWTPIIHKGFNCIYSNKLVKLECCDIDHFIPWSWVGHNQLWNLVPTSIETNRSKGAKLPNNQFIPNLANAHYQLIEFNESKKPKNWRRSMDDYIAGLHVDVGILKNKERLTNAYQDTISPQLVLANNHGFKNWEMKQ